jgi:hypothetical protein
VWVAKAKAALSTPPTTPAQARAWTAKAIPIETAELAALSKIPGRTPAGTKALAAVQTDIAEGKAALAAWSTDKARFRQLFAAWLNDRRPKLAFTAAGATACG